MKYRIGSFIWTHGSINDNIRKSLTKYGFNFYNTMNGDIYTAGDNRKITAEESGIDDEYIIYINF